MRIAVFLLLGSVAFAQDSGVIAGTISDHDGVALPKAAIQAKNMATGTVYKTDSAATGAYSLAKLPAGTYELLAQVPGMLPFEQNNVAVAAAQTVRLNIQVQDFASLNTLGEDRGFFEGLTGRHKTPAGPAPRMANGKPDFSGVWLGSLPHESGKPELTPSAQAIVTERLANHSSRGRRSAFLREPRMN